MGMSGPSLGNRLTGRGGPFRVFSFLPFLPFPPALPLVSAHDRLLVSAKLIVAAGMVVRTDTLLLLLRLRATPA